MGRLPGVDIKDSRVLGIVVVVVEIFFAWFVSVLVVRWFACT